MDILSKYVLRGAGFLIAAQIFMTFASVSDGMLDRLLLAGKLAILPIPLLAFGAWMDSENGLRSAGFTVLLWAGAGATLFLGSMYGGAEDKVPLIAMPQAHEISLGFGFANLALVVVLGAGVWLLGLKSEPAPTTYHSIG